jgi:hypothetical protein
MQKVWDRLFLKEISTPFFIYKNIKAKKENRNENQNNILLNYTLANIGYIESFKDNNEKLNQLIKH